MYLMFQQNASEDKKTDIKFWVVFIYLSVVHVMIYPASASGAAEK